MLFVFVLVFCIFVLITEVIATCSECYYHRLSKRKDVENVFFIKQIITYSVLSYETELIKLLYFKDIFNYLDIILINVNNVINNYRYNHKCYILQQMLTIFGTSSIGILIWLHLSGLLSFNSKYYLHVFKNKIMLYTRPQ